MSPRPHGPRGARRVEFVGSEWLRASSPLAVLERICDGDPLVLRDRVERHLRTDGRLLHARRVLRRALAYTARAAMGYAGDPPLAQWLDGIVRRAATQLLAEDSSAQALGLPVSREDRPFFGELAEARGLARDRVRAACNAFHALSRDARRAYYHVRVLDRRVHAYAADERVSPRRVRALVLRAETVLEPFADEARRGGA